VSREARTARLRRVSAACAAFAASVGSVVLTGWMLDDDALKGSMFAGVTMKANTAVGHLAIATSLLLLRPEVRSPARTWMGRLFALFAIALGAATLSQHLFGWDLHIDELLFREAPGAVATQSPNRMGPPASTCFPLLGFALLALDRPSRGAATIAQVVALLVAATGLVSILGYVFEAHELFGIAQYTGISFLTAVTFVVITVGIVAARPDVGMMSRLVAADSGALLIRRLLPAAVTLPIALMYLRVLGERAGFYDLYFGRALVVFSFIVTFAVLVWVTGGIVSRQEQTAQRAEMALRDQLFQAIVVLRDSEAMFRTLGEAIPDVLWMTDADGRALYRNPAWGRYTGDAEPFAGAWEANTHDDDRARLQEQRRTARENGTPFEVEVRFRRHDGVHRWFSFRTVPIRDEEGRVVKWISTGTDIEEQKRAQIVLGDGDRRKNEFLATLAHELRNPLAPVRNAVQILRMRGTQPAQAQWAHAVIDRQVDHLTRLIDDLMDVSRITHDKLELRKARVTLREVVNGAIESSRHAIDGNRQRLEVDVPAEPIHLEADAIRLVQVFMNLLTNAAKYTPPGGRIALTASRDGAEVVVRVADTGAGIAPDHMPHLFEMFYQTEEVRQRSKEGLGIGLALVRHLVRLHGGTVGAESAGRGEGSVFTVRLPLAPEGAGHASSPAISASRAQRLLSRRALVVDDNTDAAESLGVLLRFEGAEVETAHDGDQALTVAARVKPHLVLLDIGLPKRNGYDVAREIRAFAWGADSLIIAMTGWGQPHDRARSHEAGFDHHLVKPVSLDAILDLVDGSRRDP
jgi:PAS domain S-box-containing protein